MYQDQSELLRSPCVCCREDNFERFLSQEIYYIAEKTTFFDMVARQCLYLDPVSDFEGCIYRSRWIKAVGGGDRSYPVFSGKYKTPNMVRVTTSVRQLISALVDHCHLLGKRPEQVFFVGDVNYARREDCVGSYGGNDLLEQYYLLLYGAVNPSFPNITEVRAIYLSLFNEKRKDGRCVVDGISWQKLVSYVDISPFMLRDEKYEEAKTKLKSLGFHVADRPLSPVLPVQMRR